MNQFKIAFIALLIGVFTSGCYTVVYLADDEDEYVEEVAYQPPTHPYVPEPWRPVRPPDPPYIGGPHPHPRPPNYPPSQPPPEEYKTRPPENVGGNKKRDPGVIDPIRIGGGRGNDEGRR